MREWCYHMNPDVVWVELGLGKAKHEALRSLLFLIYYYYFFLALRLLMTPRSLRSKEGGKADPAW